MYNDFDSDYKTLIDKSRRCPIEVKRLITLGLEIFRSLNKLDPAFIENIFHKTTWLTHRPSNTKVDLYKTAKYSGKNLRTLGLHIWNSLPEHINAENNLIKFKELVNQWTNLQINLCVYVNKYVRKSLDCDLEFDPSLKTVLHFLFLAFQFNM